MKCWHHENVPKIIHLSIKCYIVFSCWRRISWETHSVKHLFNMAVILLNNFLEMLTNVCNVTCLRNSLVHGITWFFLGTSLSWNSTIKRHIVYGWTEGSKVPTVVRFRDFEINRYMEMLQNDFVPQLTANQLLPGTSCETVPSHAANVVVYFLYCFLSPCNLTSSFSKFDSLSYTLITFNNRFIADC